jgi:hypothetical protein
VCWVRVLRSEVCVLSWSPDRGIQHRRGKGAVREFCWVPAMVAGRPENERTRVDGPAEVRGLRSTRRRGNPAERAGSSPGGQAKAVPVEETVVQLGLPIATAENPKGATRRRTRDRLGAIRAGAPKAIDEAGIAAPASMEEVAKRLTSALLKVASNEGAPGPDGQTTEQLLEQRPSVLPRLEADLREGTYVPGEIRRAYIPKAGDGERAGDFRRPSRR